MRFSESVEYLRKINWLLAFLLWCLYLRAICRKFQFVTIVNHWSPKLEKPLKNHRCQWLILPGTIDGDGENFQIPSPFHHWRKTTIAIPSPWKIDHRSGLLWLKLPTSLLDVYTLFQLSLLWFLWQWHFLPLKSQTLTFKTDLQEQKHFLFSRSCAPKRWRCKILTFPIWVELLLKQQQLSNHPLLQCTAVQPSRKPASCNRNVNFECALITSFFVCFLNPSSSRGNYGPRCILLRFRCRGVSLTTRSLNCFLPVPHTPTSDLKVRANKGCMYTRVSHKVVSLILTIALWIQNGPNLQT